jgi:uncharacterized protein (DUF2141 family)
MRKDVVNWRIKIFAAAMVLHPALATAQQLKIEFEDVVPNKGPILVAIFPSALANSFPFVKEGAGITRLKIESTSPPYSDTVTLPTGQYAISAFQDLNNDGTIALNGPYGSPSEPWGTSNNRRPSNHAPTFSDAAFSIGDAGNVQTIRLSR